MWPLFGKILVDAWNFSLETGNLPPSHKLSFLKLIPKIGKDLKKLTNWRPITLSNCDHKIISKTYAQRLSMAMSGCIKENQTAYIKGRIINDNIRAILASIEVANSEINIDGLIVSLDAKKAFDSVSHRYIEKCLEKFGVGRFVPIFKVLYKDLQTDIIINQRIVSGFKVKRGVKQGDALSCILFIMCMEPLIRNIENNGNIASVQSRNLDSALPKAYAYADDINVVTNNDVICVQEVFKEYERLTKVSGLELNADKTEIMRFKSGGNAELVNFQIMYNNTQYRVESVSQVKINGILFHQDIAEMRTLNVDKAVERIQTQCRRWSARRLCLLGKILIVKTFGISQVVFLMQSIKLETADFKRINSVLYKFLWNRNFDAAKAPERIAREIINLPIKLGGFGMINIEALDSGIKLRGLGRLMCTNHPLLRLIKEKLNLDEFFEPRLATELDRFAHYAVELLKVDRKKMWSIEQHELTPSMVSLIRSISLNKAITPVGRNSLSYFNIRMMGIETVGGLDRPKLNQLARFMDKNLVKISEYAVTINLNVDNTPARNLTVLNGVLVDLTRASSREIREGRQKKIPVTMFKSGLLMTPSEVLNWADRLRRLTSTKLKSTMLRVAHKEVYTKEKLYRYGLVASPNCSRCDLLDTFEHKLFECSYVTRIWEQVFRITENQNGGVLAQHEIMDHAMCNNLDVDLSTQTIHAEILNRILSLRDDATYMLRPKSLVLIAINYLKKRERKKEIKDKLNELLLRHQ